MSNLTQSRVVAREEMAPLACPDWIGGCPVSQYLVPIDFLNKQNRVRARMYQAPAHLQLFALVRLSRFLTDMHRFKTPLYLAPGCAHLLRLLVLWAAQAGNPDL